MVLFSIVTWDYTNDQHLEMGDIRIWITLQWKFLSFLRDESRTIF